MSHLSIGGHKTPSYRKSILISEYESLREEMLQNKRYVFERPLLIITAAGIASIQLSGSRSVSILPLLVVVILLINLWFTVNRLRSTAVIIAYIEVILENKNFEWIGWESSLRLWRIWVKQQTQNVSNGSEDKDDDFSTIKKKVMKYMDVSAIPDAMMFYPPIYWFHLVMALVSVLVSGIMVIVPSCTTNNNWSVDNINLLVFLMTFSFGIYFVFNCIGPLNPSNMNDLVEISRGIWLAVFSDNSLKLKET